MDLYKFAWIMWLGGTILIVLSWNNTVSPEVGWIGFVTALIGVGLSLIPHILVRKEKPPRNPPNDDYSGA